MKIIPSTFVVLILVLSLFSCSKKEQKKEGSVEKEVPPTQSIQEDSLSAEKLYFEADMKALGLLKKGDTFEIKTKDGEKAMTLGVRRVQETIPGITSISANIENKETGLATLLLRDGRLSGMLELYQENTKYRVKYDTVQNAPYLQEMVPDELDVLEGGEPLKPGEDNRQQ